MKDKIKKMIRSKAFDYLLACILTTIVMLTIYNIGTLHFYEGSLWVVHLMMLIFACITAGGSVWIISLTNRVDELEEELEQLKRFR